MQRDRFMTQLRILHRSKGPLSAGLLLGCFAAACLGCASQGTKPSELAAWDVRRLSPWHDEEEKAPPQTPSRLVATWTETVLNKAGQKPLRGFGGRIAFFNNLSEDAVRVDGQLVVYAFDETSRPDHETEPTRKFIFPAEEVVRHESETKLGPAYSFWLPWDEVGGPQRNISLIARFEPRGGPIVIGEQTRHFLPGATPEPTPAPQLATSPTAATGGVRLAAHDAAGEPASGDGAASVARPHMSTATIALPRGVALPAKAQASRVDDAGGATPLAQLSTLGKGSPAELVSPQYAPPTVPPAATDQAATMAAEAPRPRETAAPAGPAAPGSLRDSLLGTLPARVAPDARPAPGRAR